MMQSTRRQLMLGTAALASSAIASAALADDPAVKTPDLSDLNTAPAGLDNMELGPKDAKVTIIEYGSATCPHCAAFYKDVFSKLKTDYIDTGKVRFIFREFPLDDQALAAFMLARCAPKEKYYPLIETFFTTQQVWMPAAYKGLQNIAQQAGISAADLDACLKNEKLAKSLLDGRDKAGKQYGIKGIPTIFINGKALEGEQTYDAVKAIIDPLLK